MIGPELGSSELWSKYIPLCYKDQQLFEKKKLNIKIKIFKKYRKQSNLLIIRWNNFTLFFWYIFASSISGDLNHYPSPLTLVFRESIHINIKLFILGADTYKDKIILI